MYKIRSKVLPGGGRENIGIADKTGRRYFFNDLTTPHEINEKQMTNLRMTYGDELEKYVSIEKVLREDPIEIIERKEAHLVDEEKTDLTFREIVEDLKQMTLEEAEALLKLEEAKEEPRKSVVYEIKKAIKRLSR